MQRYGSLVPICGTKKKFWFRRQEAPLLHTLCDFLCKLAKGVSIFIINCPIGLHLVPETAKTRQRCMVKRYRLRDAHLLRFCRFGQFFVAVRGGCLYVSKDFTIFAAPFAHIQIDVTLQDDRK